MKPPDDWPAALLTDLEAATALMRRALSVRRRRTLPADPVVRRQLARAFRVALRVTVRAFNGWHTLKWRDRNRRAGNEIRRVMKRNERR